MINGFNLDKYNVREYQSGKKSFYFDRDRKILLNITEKEEIRQKTIEYLNKELFVPCNAIRTDVDLQNFDDNGLIDILVTAYDDNGFDVPLMIVKCGTKNEKTHEGLKTEAFRQLKITGAIACGITNGKKLDFFISEENSINEKTEVFDYQSLCELTSLEAYDYEEEPLERSSYAYLYDKRAYVDGIEYGIIGEDTDPKLAPIILNINDCLMDENIKIKGIKGNGFKVIKDLGLRYSEMGQGLDGNYRIIMVEAQNEIKIVSIAVLGSEQGRACTYIVGGIDENNGTRQKTNIKVKIMLDDNLKVTNNGKVAEIFDKGNQIVKLNSSKILEISDSEIKDLIKYIINKCI